MADARARIDLGLPGRPLQALEDRPALGAADPAAAAVWDVHLARMRRIAAQARPVLADLRLSAQDPWALRLMALVTLMAAVLFAEDRRVQSVGIALKGGPAVAAAEGPSFEGWAEPPAYTRRPTLYLPEVTSDAPLSVPEGTVVTLRAYGPADGFRLAETVSDAGGTIFSSAADGIATASFIISRSGLVSLEEGGDVLGAWQFQVEPDLAPTIAMDGTLERTAAGETQLSYMARDDHGIAAARAEIALDLDRVDRRYGLAAPPGPIPPLVVDLPMPLSGERSEFSEMLVQDFSKNPLAGLPVTVNLTAEDGTGQMTGSAPVEAILPMRRFYDPLAAALIEQRRDLLWSEANGRRVAQVLKALIYRPDGLFENLRSYLITREAVRQLDHAVGLGEVATVRDSVAEALWMAAVQIEDGALGDAAARLARAKERLEQALKQGASDQEIAQLMDELREATRDYMREMAEDAMRRGDQQQAKAQPGQEITQDQIQELMNRIEELSREGRKAEAQQLLDMLQQMLQNMQMMAGQGKPGQGQGEGQQSMQGLGDALREQQGLADDSFRQLQDQFRRERGGSEGQGGQPGSQGEGQQSPSQPGEGRQADEQGSLADRQEALRQLMEQLEGSLSDQASDATRQALREAERNMGEARDQLSEGDPSGALDKQAQAIDRLREGIREFGEDMRRAQGAGEGDQGQVAGEQTSETGRDPLGRPIGARGSIGSAEQMVPGTSDDAASRARAILDELRRRASEQGRPQLELDYLRRLLDLF